MSPDKLWLDVMTQKVLKTFVTQTLIIRKAYARVMLNIRYSYVADMLFMFVKDCESLGLNT